MLLLLMMYRGRVHKVQQWIEVVAVMLVVVDVDLCIGDGRHEVLVSHIGGSEAELDMFDRLAVVLLDDALELHGRNGAGAWRCQCCFIRFRECVVEESDTMLSVLGEALLLGRVHGGDGDGTIVRVGARASEQLALVVDVGGLYSTLVGTGPP